MIARTMILLATLIAWSSPQAGTEPVPDAFAPAVVAVRGFMEMAQPDDVATPFVHVSGFFFDERGYLFTAYAPLVDPVRRRLCPRFSVLTEDGRTLPARAWNIYPLLNLAVLTIEPAAGGPYRVLELGRSRPPRVGDPLTALVRGPDGSAVAVEGAVVARSRNTLYGKGLADLVLDVHMPLPDHGFGAALLDARGQVAGLCLPPPVTASPDDLADDEVHALPIMLLQTVQKMIMIYPTFEQPWLGLDTRRASGRGLEVTFVWSDGPAAAADIRVGDRLSHADGERLSAPGDLEQRIRTVGAGRDLAVTLERSDQVHSVTVPIERRPPWAAPWIDRGDSR